MASHVNPGFPHVMWEAREAGSVIRAAERAAEARNYKTAENLLREAARLQEASLGPRHPDLANTLNNLGIVCELTDKPDEAEQYFRRAVSIARTSLPADHPFVATSQKNLRDFCEARGKKVEMPAPMPEVPKPARQLPKPAQELPNPAQKLLMPAQEVSKAAQELPKPAQEIPRPVQAVRAVNAPAPEEEAPELPANKLFYRVALGALGPIAMLMVVLAAGLPRLWPPEPAAPLPRVVVDPPKAVAPAPEPAPVEATPKSEVPEPEVSKPDVPKPEVPKPQVPTPEVPNPEATTAKTTPAVLIASLCAELEDWLCDPADRPVPPGPLFFYTQIKSASATTVQHRWYHDNRLRQTVTLRVQGNRDGYRTFSRSHMTSESAGSWRVELRSEDGTLLDEERFTVR